VKSAATVQSTITQVETPSDELVALEEENRWLKGLMTEYAASKDA
jgi:hypothetical protein